MNNLNSETNPEPISRMRGFIAALILLTGFGLIWCIGYYGGKALKSQTVSGSPCARGYSGTPCKSR